MSRALQVALAVGLPMILKCVRALACMPVGGHNMPFCPRRFALPLSLSVLRSRLEAGLEAQQAELQSRLAAVQVRACVCVCAAAPPGGQLWCHIYLWNQGGTAAALCI